MTRLLRQSALMLRFRLEGPTDTLNSLASNTWRKLDLFLWMIRPLELY